MKLASYKSTRPGVLGLFNRLIRWRLSGCYSHCEVVFEPDDGVDHLLPDGNAQPQDGAYWCASSVALERMPGWSHYRAGRIGGVRFKRIVLDPARWDLVDVPHCPGRAARWFIAREGHPYSWRLIAKFLAWMVRPIHRAAQYTCSSAAAGAFGHVDADAWRFDPCLIHVVEKDRHAG